MSKDYSKYQYITSKVICQPCWLVLTLALLIFPFGAQGSLVDDLDQQIKDQQIKQAELENKATEYQTAINEKKGEIRSLNNDIYIFDAQIGKLEVETNITEENIHQTELEIMQLEYGLEKAGDDIINNKVILAEIIRTIDQLDQTSDFEIILRSGDLSEFFNQVTYIENLQFEVLVAVEDLRFLRNKLTQDKVSEEDKRESLDDQKDELTSQQNSLNYQKGSRKALLKRSKGEEATYQKMLADIEAQKKSILGDVNRLRQLKADELARLKDKLSKPPKEYWASTSWFYKQDDPAWATQGIGRTNSSMANYGCAISAVAMVFTKHGSVITPGRLAKEPIYYYDLIVWPNSWNNIQLNTLTYRTAVDWFKIDREIGAGNPVIVRIQADGQDGAHYVVIHTKTADGNYVVHDPLFGSNIYLSSTRAYISKLYDTTTSLNQMIIYR